MSAAQVESRPTPSTAAAYDTPPATTSSSNPRSSTHPGASGEAGSQRQGGGAGGAPGGGRDRRRRGKAPAAGAAESDHQGAQARGGGRNGGGGGGGRSGGAQAEVNGESAAQQNGHRNQGASNRSANGGRGRGQGQGRPARGKANDGHAQGQTDPALDNAPGSSGANGGRQRQGRGKAKEIPAPSSSADASAQPAAEPVAPISTRKRNFGGKITTDEAASTERGNADVKGKGVAPAPVPPLIREYADLRSRLVAELGSGQYECAICYNTLTTRQPCWSCDQCYTVLHMPCTKKWASTSVDQANAQLAMQEDPEIRARRGTWRCPGCQFAREDVPQAYWCWCARVKDPQARGGLNPHSCGQRCGKGSCPHGGCAEPCHPGPCAPCAVTVSKRCHCGKHVLPIRCSQLNPSARAAGAGLQPGVATIPSEAPAAVQIERGISCSEACGKLLNCGTHSCAAVCHPGACTPCAEHINAKCYCGLQEKDLVCGSEGTAQRCVRDDDNTEWTGLWTCDTVQQKPYDCGKHFYEQSCSSSSHTTDRPPCPRSPERIKRCPCGKTALTDRTSCEDEIPTCGSKCEKVQLCGHLDSDSSCHHGPCPPCRVLMTTPCRCGESKQTRQCYEHQREESEGGQEILCSTLCKALRNCGKHVCNRRCCPLSFQAKAKGKKRPSPHELAAQDPAGFHECNVPCSKPLTCGLHACPMTCHRGPCQRCLQASFEELICFCGRTVLEPPVACGTVIQCNFPCTRPPPTCGHPKVQHNCHEGEACPPCVFLTERLCHCGKSVVQAVPCSRLTERVRCGMTCGALMHCGFHRCEGHCHRAPGDCGSCTQVCAKPRKLCGHPCTKPCHAPASCPDAEPCESIITIQCPCGHLQQKSKCGASTSNPAGRERALKCNDACAIAQRNMKLADALGINYAEKGAPAVYEADTIKFYATHRAFGDEVERAFTEFVTSSRNGMILPAAKREHRKFTHELAAVYKLSSESVDSEPKRSVSIRRLQGSRVPSPLLSEVWANALAEQTTTTTASSSSKLSTAPIDRNRQNAPGASALGNLPLNAILLESVFGHSAASLREHLETLPAGLLNSVTFELRWVTDENVLMTFEQQQQGGGSGSGSVPATLVRIRSALREMLGRTGLASRALLCVVGRDGAVLRTEEDTGPSVSNLSTNASRTASGTAANGHLASSGARSTAGGGAGVAPAKKLGGWAAIASGSASTQASRLANNASSSVWDSGVRRSAAGGAGPAASGSASNNNHQAGGPSSSSGRIVLTTSAANSARASPRMDLLPAFAREATPDDWEID